MKVHTKDGMLKAEAVKGGASLLKGAAAADNQTVLLTANKGESEGDYAVIQREHCGERCNLIGFATFTALNEANRVFKKAVSDPGYVVGRKV